MNRKRKLFIGIIVVSSPFWIGPFVLVSLLVWPYLVWTVLKKKTHIFSDQIEPWLAEMYLKKLKTSLLIAGISLVVGIVGVVMHNVLYAMNEIEESFFFWIAIIGLFAFFWVTIYGFYIFLKGRRKQDKEVLEIGGK